jgi:hypothetical protein
MDGDRVGLVILWLAGIAAGGGVLVLPLAVSSAVVRRDYRLLRIVGMLAYAAIGLFMSAVFVFVESTAL